MSKAELAGQSENFLVPVGSSLVVDGFIGSQRSNAGNFLVATRSRDEPRSVHLSELNGKDGNPAGPEDEDRRPRFDLSEIHKRMPRGYGGAWQGRGFGVGEVIGNTDQSVLIKSRIFAQDAVQVPPSHSGPSLLPNQGPPAH